MTTLARISRKPDQRSWLVTILIDGVQTLVLDVGWLAVNNANGKFRLQAKGLDESHLSAMVDIIVGPEDPKDYDAISKGAVA